MIFEPFHPIVFTKSKGFCYINDNDRLSIELKNQWLRCSQNVPGNRWLLRNHLNEKKEPSKGFIEYIWSNSSVLGFKTIRLNHSLHSLQKQLNGQIIYIYRHPLSVLQSINNRKNFWKEFSWQWHKKTFFERVVTSQNFSHAEIEKVNLILENIHQDDEIIIAMWAVSILISISQAIEKEYFLICYEDLYRKPFERTHSLLNQLSIENKKQIHPSYLFTPSMTSLSTVHDSFGYSFNSNKEVNRFFINEKFSAYTEDKLKNIYMSIIELRPEVYLLLKESDYL